MARPPERTIVGGIECLEFQFGVEEAVAILSAPRRIVDAAERLAESPADSRSAREAGRDLVIAIGDWEVVWNNWGLFSTYRIVNDRSDLTDKLRALGVAISPLAAVYDCAQVMPLVEGEHLQGLGPSDLCLWSFGGGPVRATVAPPPETDIVIGDVRWDSAQFQFVVACEYLADGVKRPLREVAKSVRSVDRLELREAAREHLGVLKVVLRQAEEAGERIVPDVVGKGSGGNGSTGRLTRKQVYEAKALPILRKEAELCWKPTKLAKLIGCSQSYIERLAPVIEARKVVPNPRRPGFVGGSEVVAGLGKADADLHALIDGEPADYPADVESLIREQTADDRTRKVRRRI